MNPNGANKWWASKKVAITTLAGTAVGICTWLATHDPNVRHQNIYIVAGAIFGLIAGNHVQAEAKIDAAAVKKSTPETVVTQNVNPENVDMDNAG